MSLCFDGNGWAWCWTEAEILYFAAGILAGAALSALGRRIFNVEGDVD